MLKLIRDVFEYPTCYIAVLATVNNV